jgi:ADP-ribosylation factor-like protein 1
MHTHPFSLAQCGAVLLRILFHLSSPLLRSLLQVSDALGLPEIKNRQWSIQETSALKGSGLFEGFDW